MIGYTKVNNRFQVQTALFFGFWKNYKPFPTYDEALSYAMKLNGSWKILNHKGKVVTSNYNHQKTILN